MLLLLILCSLAAPAGADARSEAAGRLADSATATSRAARQEGMARNVVVRLELLANAARQAARGELDSKAFFRFFSQTRKLFWESRPGASAAENMRMLEQNAVRFGALSNFSLDLPPVGASPAAAALVPAAAAPAGEVRFTREGLVQSARQADQLAQSLWGLVRNQPERSGDDRARRDLAGVAEAVHGMRMALEQGSDPGSHYQALLTNRARLLYSHGQLALDESQRASLRALLDQLDLLVAAYRQLGGDLHCAPS